MWSNLSAIALDNQSAALLTVAGMALVTYATRIAGLLLMSRVTLSEGTRDWLAGIPGAVLVSILAPIVLTRGPANALAAAITGLVALRTRNMLVSVITGVLAAWALRAVL